MKDGENWISFIKEVEITGGKTYLIHSALSNEIKCLSGFGSDGASVMIGHKEVASKFKKE